MKWYDYEKSGWSWATGWSPTKNGYYAQAWRDLPKRLWKDNHWVYRECLTESGQNISEATSKLWQRLDGFEKDNNAK